MNSLKYFLKLFSFWLIFFFVNRLFFIVNFFDEFSQISANELLKILPKSFWLDISFISYLSVIITIILFINSFFANKRVNDFIKSIIFWINAFFIVFSALIIGGEIGLYSEWGAKLNFTALSHFANPKEVFSTATIFNYFVMIISIIIAVIFVKLYSVFVHQNFDNKRFNIRKQLINIILFPLSLGVLLILVRGGIQPIPINTSDAYFSKNIILNDVTVNSNWNLVQSILKSKSNFDGNPYKKHPQENVNEFINNRKHENESTTYVLK